MSWVVRELWSSLRDRRDEYLTFLGTDKLRAFEAVNRIAYEVGKRYGIVLQLNFPPGRQGPRIEDLGHRDLSMVVHRGREKFNSVSEAQVKKILEQLEPLSIEPMQIDREGFRAQLLGGRIDCLPGAIHLWCEITPEILAVLDLLFTNTYGLKPEKRIRAS